MTTHGLNERTNQYQRRWLNLTLNAAAQMTIYNRLMLNGLRAATKQRLEVSSVCFASLFEESQVLFCLGGDPIHRGSLQPEGSKHEQS